MVAPSRSLPVAAEPKCANDRRLEAGSTCSVSLRPFSRWHTLERRAPSCRACGQNQVQEVGDRVGRETNATD